MTRLMTRLGAVAAVLLLYSGVGHGAAAGLTTDDTPITVLMDDELPLYQHVVTGLALEVGRPLEVFHLAGQKTDSAVVDKVRKLKPAAIVALGPRSLTALQGEKTPLVFSMVPRVEAYRFRRQALAGVTLDVDYSTRLRW